MMLLTNYDTPTSPEYIQPRPDLDLDLPEIMSLANCDIYLDQQRWWLERQGHTRSCRRAGPIQS